MIFQGYGLNSVFLTDNYFWKTFSEREDFPLPTPASSEKGLREFPGSQSLGLQAFTAEGEGSVPHQVAKIPQDMQCG